MKLLPYYVMAGMIVAAFIIAIQAGGTAWIAPVIVLLVVFGYAIFDRRQRARETPTERLAAEP